MYDILLVFFIILMFFCMCWFVYYIFMYKNGSPPKPSPPKNVN